jgi:hypothetical protein
MLPRMLDQALADPLMDIAKFLSLPLLVGLLLGLSWPRMPALARLHKPGSVRKMAADRANPSKRGKSKPKRSRVGGSGASIPSSCSSWNKDPRPLGSLSPGGIQPVRSFPDLDGLVLGLLPQ